MMNAVTFVFRYPGGGRVNAQAARAVYRLGDRLVVLVECGEVEELLEKLAYLTERLGLAECMATYAGLAAKPPAISDFYAAVAVKPGPQTAGVAFKLTPGILSVVKRIRFYRVDGEVLYALEYVRPLSVEEMIEESMLPAALLECLGLGSRRSKGRGSGR